MCMKDARSSLCRSDAELASMRVTHRFLKKSSVYCTDTSICDAAPRAPSTDLLCATIEAFEVISN